MSWPRAILTAALFWAAVTLLAFASTAVASQDPLVRDRARVGTFMPIARAAWPPGPCTGREVVRVGADAFLDTVGANMLGQPPGWIVGLAEPTTCEVWIRGGMSATYFCVILVHEFGHLAGVGHNDRPGDVMNANGDVNYWPCWDFMSRVIERQRQMRRVRKARARIPAMAGKRHP